VEEDEIFMSDSEYSDEGSDEGISNKVVNFSPFLKPSKLFKRKLKIQNN